MGLSIIFIEILCGSADEDKMSANNYRLANLAVMRSSLRKFDLTVDEIRVMKVIKALTNALAKNGFTEMQSLVINFFRAEIEKLEQVMETTLIKLP